MPPNRGITPNRTGNPGIADLPLVSRTETPLTTDPLLQAAFYLTVLYVFLFASRLPEFMLSQLRPMLVLAVVLLAAALLSGRLLGILETRTGWLLVIFTGWMAFVTLFSRWRGGSVQVVIGFLKTFLFLVIMAALVRSVPNSLRITYAAGFAMGAVAVMARLFGTGESSRLEVQGSGTLGDPNFFCLYILTGLPLLWLKARHASWIGKILPLGLGLFVLWSALLSESRSGLISFLAGMLFLFWHAASRHKLKLLAVSAGLGVILVIAAPQGSLRRLTTWFEIQEPKGGMTEEERRALEMAVGSAEFRRYLFEQSIRITLENPLVGVGPGMFMEAEAAIAQQEDRRGAWRHTHNMYTQVSSETGIPGLALFLAILVSVYRSLTRVRKRAAAGRQAQHHLVYDAALYLQVALVIVLVNGLFLNIALGGPIYILSGLAISLEGAVRREWAALPVPAANTARG